jgi:hypothetical protein
MAGGPGWWHVSVADDGGTPPCLGARSLEPIGFQGGARTRGHRASLGCETTRCLRLPASALRPLHEPASGPQQSLTAGLHGARRDTRPLRCCFAGDAHPAETATAFWAHGGETMAVQGVLGDTRSEINPAAHAQRETGLRVPHVLCVV